MDSFALNTLSILAIGMFLALLHSFTSAAIQRRRLANTIDEPYEAFVKDMAKIRPKPLKSLDYSPSSATPTFIEPPVVGHIAPEGRTLAYSGPGYGKTLDGRLHVGPVKLDPADALMFRHYGALPLAPGEVPRIDHGMSERDCE